MIPLRMSLKLHKLVGRSKILHQGGKRVQTITANIENYDLNEFIDNVTRV